MVDQFFFKQAPSLAVYAQQFHEAAALHLVIQLTGITSRLGGVKDAFVLIANPLKPGVQPRLLSGAYGLANQR